MRKLFVLFVIVVLPLAGFADAVQIGSLWYNLDESTKTAEVTSSGGDAYSGNIVIPATVQYGGINYTVSSIGNNAFSSSSITSVVIPEGIETIGQSAFWACYSMSVESLPSTLKSIGEGAFWNCNGIKKLSFALGLETIGNSAFSWCYGLDEVEFPSTLTSIGAYAFRGCPIIKLELPSSLTSIGDYAFAEMNQLSFVTSRINSPFEIRKSVFCSSYSYSWSEAEGKDVYTYTPSGATLYIPAGLKSAYQSIDGWNMFADIVEGELKEATIDGLKYSYVEGKGNATVIGRADEELRNITIPATVRIGNTNYSVKTVGAAAFQNCGIDTLVISEGIETIGIGAFRYSNLGSVTLPTSLRSIGNEAFYYCYGIKQLIIPQGVTTIGQSAFYNCSSIQQLELPSSLTEIGDRAFSYCGNLFSVTSRINSPFEISQSVFCSGYSYSWSEVEGKDVYTYTPSGATLYIPAGLKSAYQSIDGWNMFADIVEGELKETTVDGLKYSYVEGKGNATVIGRADEELRNITIPATVRIGNTNYSVKTVGAAAFQNCGIDTLVISEGIETIGSGAFYECDNLIDLELPSTLKTIEDYAFLYCRMASLVLPEGLTSIGAGAFYNCYNLQKLELPSSLKSIGSDAFKYCGSLTSVISRIQTPFEIAESVFARDEWWDYEEQKSVLTSSSATLYVPVGKKSAYEVFEGWMKFKEIIEGEPKEKVVDGLNYLYVLGGSIAKVIAGDYSTMESISIPGSITIDGVKYDVQEIGDRAFIDCSKLVTIEFPNTLRHLGEESFEGCNSLLNVVSNIEEPKEINESVFGDSYNNVYSQTTLWVPKGKIDTYKKVEGWSRFENIDELLRDTLTKPTVSYNGHYLTMTNNSTQRAKIYYSTDGSAPTILYSDTIVISNLGTVQAISKRFGSYTVDTTRYEISYVFDGVTARTTSAGLLAKAFEWCGTDKVEMLDIDATLNEDDFGAIRSLTNLKTLNMAASKIENSAIPAEAFANMKLQWYVSPYTMTSVGNNIFKGCQQLTAITWNSSSIELPKDVVTDVANPNMLVYAKAQAMIPYALKNVIVNGVANNIVLIDSTGNNNFNCPEQFLARHITYTHNYQQKTARGVTQGWETLALPFTVSKIVHETKGVITPMAVEGAEKPFWLYELGDNGLVPATQIRANVPYLICMPNDDDYGDEYILGGRVTFSASNVTISTSGGKTVSQGNLQFVPTYQAVAKADGVYALNVGQTYSNNPIGSVFVPDYREVRPFEAYSVHSNNMSRMISVSSLVDSDAAGINDVLLKKNGGQSDDTIVKVYSLSGALVKQGKREVIFRSLPKGLYIIDGKKVMK